MRGFLLPTLSLANICRCVFQVQSKLRDTIKQTERQMGHIQEARTQWTIAKEMQDELSDWLRAKQKEVEDMEARPAKLHVAPAEAELAKLQVCAQLNIS